MQKPEFQSGMEICHHSTGTGNDRYWLRRREPEGLTLCFPLPAASVADLFNRIELSYPHLLGLSPRPDVDALSYDYLAWQGARRLSQLKFASLPVITFTHPQFVRPYCAFMTRYRTSSKIELVFRHDNFPGGSGDGVPR